MIQKFELKWDIVTQYGMQTIKWPYPPVAGVWGRWWPDLLAQKKPGPGGTGQGEAPRAVQTWRLPSSKAATFGDDYLIKRMSGIHLAIPVFSKGYRQKQGKVVP